MRTAKILLHTGAMAVASRPQTAMVEEISVASREAVFGPMRANFKRRAENVPTMNSLTRLREIIT